jgi:hypothetical protein
VCSRVTEAASFGPESTSASAGRVDDEGITESLADDDGTTGGAVDGVMSGFEPFVGRTTVRGRRGPLLVNVFGRP